MRVPLASIAFDAGTQIRQAISEDVVAEYADRMTEGVIFPPVVLFHDGNHYYMADGFHRALAAKRNDFTDIEADVQPGTKTDALWFALGANRTNGQRLSELDKQHAVLMALRAWPEKMQREIAEQVGCSESLVSKVSLQDTAKNTGVEPGLRGRALASQTKRAAVREMVKAGDQSIDIKRKVGVSSEMIADVRRELGLSTIDYSRTAVKARHDRMREMAAEGYSSRQIAAEVGMTDHRCRELMKREGIDVPADRAIGKTKRHDSTRIIERIVADAENLTEGTNLIAFAEVDRSQIPAWLDSLQESREKLGTFIRRLMKERQNHGEAA